MILNKKLSILSHSIDNRANLRKGKYRRFDYDDSLFEKSYIRKHERNNL